MTDISFKHISLQIRALAEDLSPLDEVIGPMAKVALSDLLIARLAGQSDTDWLRDFLTSVTPEKRSRLAFCVGAGASGTPIEIAASHLDPLDPPDIKETLAELAGGINYGVQKSFSLRSGPDPDPDNLQSIRSKTAAVSNDLADQMLRATTESVSRSDFLSLFNAIILIEESVLMSAWKEGGDAKSLRKIASEYAFLRLLGQFSDWTEASIKEIRIAMDLIGRMVRLSNPVSDALDRAWRRASSCRRDPDLLEAAILSGCPIHQENIADVGAAATQCRLFRDGAKL